MRKKIYFCLVRIFILFLSQYFVKGLSDKMKDKNNKASTGLGAVLGKY